MSAIDDLLALLDDARSHMVDPALIVVPPAFWKTLNEESTPLTHQAGLSPGLALQGFDCCRFYGVPITARPDAMRPFIVGAKELKDGAAGYHGRDV